MHLVPRFCGWSPVFFSCGLGNTQWLPGPGGKQGGLHSRVPWDCNNQSSWLAATPRSLNRQETETHPIFWWKRATCFCWSSSMSGRLQAWHASWGLWKCFQGMEANGCHLCTLPLPYASLLVFPRKEFICLYGAPIFVTASQGTPPVPSSGGQWGLCLQSYRTVYIWSLKGAAWGCGFPSQWF